MQNRLSARRKDARYGNWILAAFVCLITGSACHADRTVLSPNGDTLAPEHFKTEFALSPSRNFSNLIWMQYSTPQGIEVETERLDLNTERKKGYAFNVQYPLFYDLGPYPAVAIGVRDLLGTAEEHGAFYLAVSKALPLSGRQTRFVREFKWSAGLGTGRLDGPFFGVEARFAAGLSVHAEFYRQRPNIGIALPLARNMQARAYSLDGDLFYGVSFSIAH